jgi:hypothetical protein
MLLYTQPRENGSHLDAKKSSGGGLTGLPRAIHRGVGAPADIGDSRMRRPARRAAGPAGHQAARADGAEAGDAACRPCAAIADDPVGETGGHGRPGRPAPRRAG